MKIENVLDHVVWVNGDDMTELLESGVLPPAVIDRAVARGYAPDTRLVPAKMVGQATCFIDDCVVDIPGLYLVTVKCTDERNYPLQITVAELDIY